MRFAWLIVVFNAGCNQLLGIDRFTSSSDAPATTVDATKTVDANAPADANPLECSGMPIPSAAPAVVSFAGTIFTLSFAAPIAGVSLDAFKVGDSAPLLSTMTDSQGHFSFSISTGGAPIDVYLRARSATYQDLYIVPPVPLYQDYVGLSLVMYQASQLAQFRDTANVSLGYDASNVLVVANAVDCAGTSLSGAALSTTPAGRVHYLIGNSFPVGAAGTDASGLALIFNVPPGTITANGTTASGDTLRAHSFSAPAGAVVETQIQP